MPLGPNHTEQGRGPSPGPSGRRRVTQKSRVSAVSGFLVTLGSSQDVRRGAQPAGDGLDRLGGQCEQ